MIYLIIALAVIGEVCGTTFMKQSEQFSKLWPSLASASCYIFAFYMLSIIFSRYPAGIAYAIWSGLGIVLITAVGVVYFKEKIDLAAWLGIGLILTGVVVINVLSKAAVH